MNENIPSYLEFFNKVKSYFVSCEPNLDPCEVDRYFGSEEAVEELSYRYFQSIDELTANEITLEQMMVGEASSVAYCLSLMYE